MKNPGTVNHDTDALLRPAHELKRGEMLSILSKRYHYGENTLRIYISKGEIFSKPDLKSVYENIEQSDEEYKAYVARVRKTMKETGEKVQSYAQTNPVNSGRKPKQPVPVSEASTATITLEGGTISSWSSATSVFVKLKQDIDNQIETLQKKKESIEEVEKMYERLESNT